jgi:LPPG:FO 2-phospho-L-lactate transferase
MNVLALAGGVGGARFADGLAAILPPGTLTVIVNTGDDFRRYGLSVSPDLDTVMYNLAGLAHPVNGWGLDGDTQQMLGMMRRYGDDAWFGLADKDLATHLLRTQWLAEGKTLTEVTRRLSSSLGITNTILPMSNDPAPTLVDTVEHGVLPFQEYFVRHRWQPTVREVRVAHGVAGTDQAREALQNADLIIICPSNPLLSILPILEVEGYRALLQNRRSPCIVISPIIRGQAVKGPAAKLMIEIGLEASAQGILDYYKDVADSIVIDSADSVDGMTGVRALKTDILMRDPADRARLAKEVVEWIKG